MLKLYQFLTLIICSLCICIVLPQANANTNHRNRINTNNLQRNNNKNNENTANNAFYKQKLTLIGYASEEGPARHLIAFSKRYNLDLHLIGVDQPWAGFNDKIRGFYNFIKSVDNTHNNSIILILDSYDTVPICNDNDLLDKFNSFDSDIVMSTGKDCWPDPNVGQFLNSRLSQKEKDAHQWFPWFLCPNSGAIMGKQRAMLSMFERVMELVTISNGSCNDFEGNRFSKNTQSDQRCYTTYFVELTKYNEWLKVKANKTAQDIAKSSVIDISTIDNDDMTSADGSISKHFIGLYETELAKYYHGIKMRLDYSNDLFLSVGGMMFMDFDVEMTNQAKHVSFRSKITNGTSCILHGNGPGVILWRSFVKQIKNNGNLYVDDYVLRVGVDFFHWILWWIIMPCERLSHWLSITYGVDMGFHSTTFSEEVIWRFHVWTFVAVVLMLGFPLLYWYKYKFIKNMKINKMGKNKNTKKSDDNIMKENKKIRKSNSFLNIKNINNNPNKRNNYHPITQQLVKGLVNLEIMVHHNGNTFPLLKTQKKS